MNDSQLQRKTLWDKRFLAISVGTGAAGLAATVLAGLAATAPLLPSIIGVNVSSAAIGGLTGRVVHNIANADDILYIPTRPADAQQTYRKVILETIGKDLETYVTSIRENRPQSGGDTFELDSNCNAAFKIFEVAGGEKLKFVLRYKISVSPRADTSVRKPEEGVEAPPLPTYVNTAMESYYLPRTKHSWYNGCVRSTALGSLGGLVGAGVEGFFPAIRGMHFFHWVPNYNAGILIGVPTASAAGGATLQQFHEAEVEKTTLEMAKLYKELGEHFFRLLECARRNDVILTVNARCGYRQAVNVNVSTLDLNSDIHSGFEINKSINVPTAAT
ncbi:hypothetical protein FA10DRAFT_188234 [Acaromyces ingoldii]|uniref:Uncharacterized protein n=1 Tax=Acaromyces ingoldii TaxID=215250 RepID=A0A316YEB1_9BASI|nr:hypothetical protein FA10DRAFT_188234 [Acaromyces ingoldii]PWN87532.1 hypothetical protein FA10DRAFT_188234 [Acaromyces ingoldii]